MHYASVHSDIAVVLKRIAHMARGIGDPLVVAYARCYLARVSLEFFCIYIYIYIYITVKMSFW